MDTLEVVNRLLAATNAHHIDTQVECFSPDYVNETPTHPLRGFRGREQVRSNWRSIFAGVPDITARIIASAVDGDRAWTEWEMSGTRRDGARHAMTGVIIFNVHASHIVAARFYLEPVEFGSGDVDAAIARATKASTL